MPLEKKAQTSFTKGELSAFVGARPDLAAYFSGASIIENFLVFPEGGATNEGTGTLFVGSPKFADKRAIIVDFIFNVSTAYHLEIGDGYTRVYSAQWAALLIELVTPWAEAELPDLQWRQSADILYVVHPAYQQRQINRLSNTNWTVTLFAPDPPPSFVQMQVFGTTLTPSATTGVVTFTASGSTFINGDVTRHIKYGLSRAVITVFTDSTHVDARVISAFPDTDPIPSGEWTLTGSPGATLNPDVRGPIGSFVTLEASGAAFRETDVGKFIKIWGGVVEIVVRTDGDTVIGIIEQEMTDWDTSENPDAALAGTWTLEVASWSDDLGWPGTVEFHQGRLTFGATDEFPTTFWQSESDDFPNFGLGVEPHNALEFSVASRRVNRFQWLVSLGSLFIGDAEQEIAVKGAGVDTPLGGDQIPYMKESGDIGSIHHEPVVVDNSVLFINRFKNKVVELSYSFDDDSYTPKNKTLLARQIGAYRFAHHRPVYAQEPNKIVYFVLENGQLGCLTINKAEQIIAWSRIVTDGFFESVSVIPGTDAHIVSVIVRRTINGATVRFIERFADGVYTHGGVFTTVLAGATQHTGLTHLAGETVAIRVGGSYIGTAIVSGAGVVTFPQVVDAAGTLEIGLPYTSTLRTMRVAAPNNITLGHKRHWVDVVVELYTTIGGTLNDEELQPLTDTRPYSGPVFAHPSGADYDGYLTIKQTQPYPISVLGLAGLCSFSDNIG